MRIFISWSGTRSQWIAKALRDWLPNVIQSLRPFVSTRDIGKGTRGGSKIAQELEGAKVGIICLTEENLTAPWILFEAGALSKSSAAHVCTLLYELNNSDVLGPLGQFQHTKVDKDEIAALLRTINDELGEFALDISRLDEAFSIWWPKLEEKLMSTPSRPPEEPVPEKPSSEDKINEILNLMREMHKPNPPLVRNDSLPAAHSVESSLIRGPFYMNGDLSLAGTKLLGEIIATTNLSYDDALDMLKSSESVLLSKSLFMFKSNNGKLRVVPRQLNATDQPDASSSASNSASMDT